MTDEHLYIISYDIRDPRRWRAVYRTLQGAGEWLQLSVFQCRLSRMRHAQLVQALTEIMKPTADHILIMDLGPAINVQPKVLSIGRAGFAPVTREPVIV